MQLLLARDFQLTLDPALASLPVVRLGAVVLGHDLHELPGERGVLRLADAEVRGRLVDVLLLLDVLLDDYGGRARRVSAKCQLAQILLGHTFELGSNFVGRLLDVRHEILQLLLHFCNTTIGNAQVLRCALQL